MDNESAVKMNRLYELADSMASMGYRFDEFLEGFKLYDKFKGTLDPQLYEDALEMFHSAIDAYEEQMVSYHKAFTEFKRELF